MRPEWHIFFSLSWKEVVVQDPLKRQLVCPRAEQEAASLPLEGASALWFHLSIETLGGALSCFAELAAGWVLFRP